MPRKPAKKPVLPTKLLRLMAAMSAGQRIVVTINGDERHYCLENSGKPVGPWTFNQAVERGLIVPGHDGLFPSAESQTWMRAP